MDRGNERTIPFVARVLHKLKKKDSRYPNIVDAWVNKYETKVAAREVKELMKTMAEEEARV